MTNTNREIGGYRLVRQIGAGGMGSVWEAVDGGGQRVALKILHPAIAHDPVSRERLRREAHIINCIKSHGVAHVLDLEVDSEQPFVVTELIDGPTLARDVTANGPWNREDLADLADWLRRILTELHASGVLHRDIKPSNIMISAQGPVLIDFGIAQMANDERFTSTGLVTGTPGYLAPEVIAGDEPSPMTDWWAWAAVLVFCATGRQPFGTGSIEAIIARVSTGQADVKGVDEQIRLCLLSALRPDPARRTIPETVVAGLSADPEDFNPAAFAEPATQPLFGDTDLLPQGGNNDGTEFLYSRGRTTVLPEGQVLDDQGAVGQGPLGYGAAERTAVMPHEDVVGAGHDGAYPGDGDSTQGVHGNYLPPAPGYPGEDVHGRLAGTGAGLGAGAGAGSIAYQAEDSAAEGGFHTQDMPEQVGWHTPYRPSTAKHAPVTGFLEAVLLSGLAIVTRGAAIYIVPIVLVCIGIVGYVRRRTQYKRMNRGYASPGDISSSLMKTPLYLVRSLFAVAGAAIVSGFVAFFGWLGVQYFIFGTVSWPRLQQAWGFPSELNPQQVLWLWIVLGVGLLVAWWFPAGSMYRNGSRYLHDLVIQHWSVRLIVIGVLIAVIVSTAISLNVVHEISQFLTHIMSAMRQEPLG
ncbi:MAG: protein kinase [Actinomycetaceae bacterium]|nr:protein kinase [Actinomycetaceae bacterium]